MNLRKQLFFFYYNLTAGKDVNGRKATGEKDVEEGRKGGRAHMSPEVLQKGSHLSNNRMR